MGDLIVFFTRQTIRPGEQGQCRQSTSAQLRNERRVFLFSNRQQCHWISERLTRGSMGKRVLLNPPFWLADSSDTWLSLPLSLLLICLQGGHSEGGKEKASLAATPAWEFLYFFIYLQSLKVNKYS